MDQGLKAAPNLRSFLKFLTTGTFFPTNSIHGYELGSILMVNDAFGLTTEKVPYANPGGVTEFEDPTMMAPSWTIKGNQYPTRLRELLIAGTKQADVVQASASGVTQTIASVMPGATYNLGVLGVTTLTATVSGAARTNGSDFEFIPTSGMVRILEGGRIQAGDSVVFTYDVPPITMEEYTAFDQPSRSGRLYLDGVRVGDIYVNERWFLDGQLFTNKMGDSDPKKHREWEMKMTSIGNPRFRMAKV